MGSLFNTSSMIFLSIFLISIVPSSIAKKDEALDLHHTICSKTTNPRDCLNLKHVKTSSNIKSITKASIDVALNKAKDIHAKLNALYKTEKDKHLKDIYLHCSKNYNDAIRDLTIAKKNFDSRKFKSIPFEANDAEEEVKACKTVFNAAKRDPANIKKGNEEFYLLSQIVRQCSEELAKK